MGPRKCSHLEDTPQAGGLLLAKLHAELMHVEYQHRIVLASDVAGIPQDQHGLGIVEESTDALHPFLKLSCVCASAGPLASKAAHLFEHGVLLVDANLETQEGQARLVETAWRLSSALSRNTLCLGRQRKRTCNEQGTGRSLSHGHSRRINRAAARKEKP